MGRFFTKMEYHPGVQRGAEATSSSSKFVRYTSENFILVGIRASARRVSGSER